MPQRHEVSSKVAEILANMNIPCDHADVDWNKQAGGGMRIAIGVQATEEQKKIAEAAIKKEFGQGVQVMLFEMANTDD